MSDKPPALFRKVLGRLVPVNDAARTLVAAMDDMPTELRLVRTRGNRRRNAFYWVTLDIAAPHLSERIEGPAIDATLLHRVLKKKRGLVRIVRLPSGDTVEDYESTSFAAMSEPDRTAFIDWAVATLSKWLGVEVHELQRESEAA